MGYVNIQAIKKSRENIKISLTKGDTFAGLILLLTNIKQKILDNYILANMAKFSEDADKAFYLNDSTNEIYSEKSWYALFTDDWIEQVKQTFLNGKQISASDFAISLYWYENFDDEDSLISFLRARINDDHVFNSFFNADKKNILFTESTSAKKAHILDILGGDNSAYTVKFNGEFVKKKAGELSGAPFGQTLYAGNEIKRIVSITDFDFLKQFDLNVGKSKNINPVKVDHSITYLSKSFILLAGISGTGKTRFVRKQAAAHNKGDSNYCLIPVRPDWHEPSDLLGYISRIGSDGPRYIVTDLLLFVVQAWLDAVELDLVTADDLVCKDPSQMIAYWLCLDEMNLAPVEQYFADYLSVVETREWKDDLYSCDALLKAVVLEQQLDKDGQNALRKELKLEGTEFDILWSNFLKSGISLPPNLIVAGTVNMDETTHGFSRKVIDRAFTIDFGVFYPNDYDHYFESPIRHKTLSFPLLSQVSKEDLSVVSADSDGQNSIDFLTAINAVLKGTPFELAYRALNELLLAVVSFAPENMLELQAVWDDFLMTKVLPRIDGDTEKLSNSVDDNSSDILSALLNVIDISFKEILIKNQRLDLLRENKDEKENPLMIPCRSKQKLEWMKARLTLNGFTTFWP